VFELAWAFTQPAGTAAAPEAETTPAMVEAAPPCTEAITVIFWETLVLESVAVTVMVTLPDGVELEVVTVKVAEPEPPVIVVVSKLETTFEVAAEELSVTLPVKPFCAVTLIVYVPLDPAVITWDGGLADNVNSEFPPPPPGLLPTVVRRGEITQPFATINRIATENANLRMGNPLFRGRLINRKIIYLDCFCGPRCLPLKP